MRTEIDRRSELLGHADDPAGDSAAGVPRRLSKIVRIFVEDDRSSCHGGIGTVLERETWEKPFQRTGSIWTDLHISEVAGMRAFQSISREVAVFDTARVIVTSCRCAAILATAELMDVEPMEARSSSGDRRTDQQTLYTLAAGSLNHGLRQTHHSGDR